MSRGDVFQEANYTADYHHISDNHVGTLLITSGLAGSIFRSSNNGVSRDASKEMTS
jgi:hypothetical protein